MHGRVALAVAAAGSEMAGVAGSAPVVQTASSMKTLSGVSNRSIARAVQEGLTRKERIQGLLTVHAAARQYFAWFDRVPHLDWDGAFAEYLPLVEQDQSLEDFYRVLERFVALLQDGHSSVRLPEEVQRGLDLLPLQLEVVEDQWVVVQRYPVEEILREDVPVGSVLISIEGRPAAAYFRERVYPYIPAGSEHLKQSSVNWAARFARNSSIRVELRYPDGATRRRLLKANRSTATWPDDLKRRFTPSESQPPFSSKRLSEDILFVRFGLCDSQSEKQFCELINSLSNRWPRALILDLRDNPGGNTPHGLIRHLISQPTKAWQRRTRCAISELDGQLQAARRDGASEQGISEAIRRAIEAGDLPKGYSPGWLSSEGVLEPEAAHYDGPLYLLVNGQTGSAAEDVAAMLKGCGRAIIVGAPTAGSTGNTICFGLPGGGDVRICTVQVKYADGRDFVPLGVLPDVAVHRTSRGVIEMRDEVFEVARALAQKSLGAWDSGKQAPENRKSR